MTYTVKKFLITYDDYEAFHDIYKGIEHPYSNQIIRKRIWALCKENGNLSEYCQGNTWNFMRSLVMLYFCPKIRWFTEGSDKHCITLVKLIKGLLILQQSSYP